METLIQRLVANPHDEEALAYAHRAGTQDPRSYAILLEKVGSATADPAYAAHWLSEAANVWSTTLGDAHHAARTLMIAIEKDPTQRTAADRLAQLYRDKGDQKALVALLERLVKALSPLAYERAEVRSQLIGLHEELGKLWGEPPLSRPERAVENWRRLAELDPQNAYAIYTAREILKAQQQFAEAVPFFAMEQALVTDPERKSALYRDEADIRRRAGDLAGAVQVMRTARTLRPDDVAMTQELGLFLLERIGAGGQVDPAERDEAAQLFVSLAEMYDGEYGFSYSTSALKAQPGHDRAMQLADHYGKQLNRTGELAPVYAAYLQANPGGFMAAEARMRAGALPPPPAPLPPIPSAGAAGGALVAGIDVSTAPPTGTFSVSAATGFTGAAAPLASGAEHTGPSRPSTPLQGAGNAGTPPVAAAPSGDLTQLLAEALDESQRGRKQQALAKYREVLRIDPANAEALSWVEEHLRQKRMYADLRDVLLAASRAPSISLDTRKAQLRDVAGICESQLRDIDTAIQAWKQICQIDRGDDQARDQLRRLLERGARWDELSTVLEQEAMGTPDIEQKIALEKKLATLHEQKRKDVVAAAEAWARIANLSPEDESAIQTAVKLFEKGERFDLAAQVISDTIPSLSDKVTRGPLLQKLGDLRTRLDDLGAAGDAYAEAAEVIGQAKVWELAEKAYLAAGRLTEGANALDQRAQLTDGKPRAALFAQAADLLLRSGDIDSSISRLEQATEIEPANDTYATALEEQYRRADRMPDLVQYLLGRADKLGDRGRRIAARRAAADVQRHLGDTEGARESLLLLLSDGDDPEALAQLVEDAVQRDDHQESVELLRRLGAITKNHGDRLQLALREARILAEGIGDIDGAIERYEAIYRTLDPKSRVSLRAMADLEERRGNPQGTADALEREIQLAEGDDRVEIAQRLATLYEGPLQNPPAAIKALEIINAADPEDFDAIARLQRLSEEIGDWPKVAALMAMLIDVEGDEEEASNMTRRLAGILHDRLGKGDEALACLERLADQGDEPCRDAYVELGDKLGWKGIVATKLVAWNESAAGPARVEALRGAFERFVEIGRGTDAARVAMELARSRAADSGVAARLEEIAVRLKDLDALSVAHEILAKELSGPARAGELVRQAEVQVSAGVDPVEAMSHGETGLASVPPAEVEVLLARLAALTQAPAHVIDLYERQVSRCRLPADRLTALARAAQVAAERGAQDRARSFFELALSGGVQDDIIAALESAAGAGDSAAGSVALRTILAEALAAGGQGTRDGGRTRAALLRRAATIAFRDLRDVERAFNWLGDALITHVDDASLDAIEQLGQTVGDMARVAATLSRALEEVFDGPLVRKLLHRRARLRRDVLGDRKGAAVDLKKLHDLSPADQDVMNDLSSLLMDLGDHRGMIQLYEDQILRGRDQGLRAELARKVAQLWEEEIGDAREAADAWRRVLRMKAGDPEASAGLERAKGGKLKRSAPVPVASSAAPLQDTAAATGALATSSSSPLQPALVAAEVHAPHAAAEHDSTATFLPGADAERQHQPLTSDTEQGYRPYFQNGASEVPTPVTPGHLAPETAGLPHAEHSQPQAHAWQPEHAGYAPAQQPPAYVAAPPEYLQPQGGHPEQHYAQGSAYDAYAQQHHQQPGYAPAAAQTEQAPGYEQHDAQGYPQPAYPQPGYAQQGYPQQGYEQHHYAQAGYAQPGYAQPGYAQPGYAPYDQQPGGAPADPYAHGAYPQQPPHAAPAPSPDAHAYAHQEPPPYQQQHDDLVEQTQDGEDLLEDADIVDDETGPHYRTDQ
ncbi:hypothetical protein [Chondromyces apiculatus]|uniref:Adventurous gliding motility protein K n=1 Tax=Chondromyces apiculatus DSM 436 TaxID=1192034 RepID=A0A017T4G1_9BACT|nr:hypothetical protein [Chondromyces apiculatus]EYF03700.1 Adventurous gliding motility protein K [Chondromyces apiculatus DSM 436]